MSRLREAQEKLDKAKAAAQDDATKNLAQAVQIILIELADKETKESNARVSPNAVRTTTVHKKP